MIAVPTVRDPIGRNPSERHQVKTTGSARPRCYGKEFDASSDRCLDCNEERGDCYAECQRRTVLKAAAAADTPEAVGAAPSARPCPRFAEYDEAWTACRSCIRHDYQLCVDSTNRKAEEKAAFERAEKARKDEELLRHRAQVQADEAKLRGELSLTYRLMDAAAKAIYGKRRDEHGNLPCTIHERLWIPPACWVYAGEPGKDERVVDTRFGWHRFCWTECEIRGECEGRQQYRSMMERAERGVMI